MFDVMFSRWATFCACLAVSCCAGTIYAYGIWEESLNLSLHTSDLQTAKNELYQACLIGNYIPIAGFVYDFVGARRCMAVGILLNLTGYLLVWAAITGHMELEFWQLLASFFMFGHGSSYLDAVVITTGSKNFASSRGTVLGVSKAMYGLSASVFTQVYDTGMTAPQFLLLCGPGCAAISIAAMFFVNEVPSLAGQSSGRYPLPRIDQLRFNWAASVVVATAMVLFGASMYRAVGDEKMGIGENVVLTTVMLLLLLAVLLVLAREHPLCWSNDSVRAPHKFSPHVDEVGNEAAIATLISPGEVEQEAEEPLAAALDMTLPEVICSWNFWLLLFVLLCGMGTGLTFIANATAACKSLKAESMKNVISSLLSLGNALGRLLAGKLSDVFKRRVSRPALLCCSLGIMSVSQFVLSGLESVDTTFIVASTAIGVSYGSYWTLSPAIIGDIFGNKTNFARTYSIFGLAPTAGSLFFSTIMASRIYENHKTVDSGDDCIGNGCFQETFIILGGMCFFGLAMALWLTVRTWRTHYFK